MIHPKLSSLQDSRAGQGKPLSRSHFVFFALYAPTWAQECTDTPAAGETPQRAAQSTQK